MILRKPYGFLIKHFKLIHLILTFIYIYLTFKVSRILTYYNNFISGSASKLDALNYVNNFYLVAIFASIIICLTIWALMRYKKKPKLLYLILIALYIVVAVIINISFGGLETIYMSTLDVKTQRLYRDLLRIIIIFQYISIAFTLVRGLGFDIKKFNFKEDIAELELDVTDEEEVELTLGNTEGIQRKIRRKIRDYKYYYQENKFFINTIIIIIILLIPTTITINKEVINKVYEEGENITTDSYIFNVTNSYITTKNYNGQTILTTDTSFVIAKINITPNNSTSKLNTGNLILVTNGNSYSINQKYYTSLSDLGTGYQNQKIEKSKTYIFVFKVNNEDIKNKMQLIYASDKTINITPTNLDEINNTQNYKLNQTLDFSSSILNSGNLTITSYEINNKYTYDYTYEISGKEYTSNINITSPNNTILNLKLSSSLPNNLTIYELLSNYAQLKYTISNYEYTSSLLNNKTPGSYNEGLYLEVDKNIAQATSIWLEITIRNSTYTYTIK